MLVITLGLARPIEVKIFIAPITAIVDVVILGVAHGIIHDVKRNVTVPFEDGQFLDQFIGHIKSCFRIRIGKKQNLGTFRATGFDGFNPFSQKTWQIKTADATFAQFKENTIHFGGGSLDPGF